MIAEMMSNPDLPRMASEGMKKIRQEFLRIAAEQMKNTPPEEIADMSSSMANATPEKIASMTAQTVAQRSCACEGVECKLEEQPPRDDAEGEGKLRSSPGFAVVVMGVSGSGKSTVGKLLTKSVHCPFIDADDFHSEENIEKMRNGIPLTEEDRLPWIESLRNELGKYTRKGEWVVLACSALRSQYRDALLTANYPNQDRQETVTNDVPDGNVKSAVGISTGRTGTVVFAYLKGSAELFASRLAARHKEGTHFMPPSLLQSQLDLLEVTKGDHDIITLDASMSPEEMVDSITDELLKRV